MALRVAIANGNWSNPSTWYLGVKPTVGDIVASNGFTVTIDEDINVNYLTNTVQLPTSIIPLMTSSTTPSGVVSANNFYQNSPNYAPYKAFDRSVSTNANHWLTDGAVPLWLEYEFPSPKIIVAYSLETGYSNLPNSWQFQAWNGSTWVVLDTVTGSTSNNYQTRTFTNTVTYTRYRIYITALNGSNTGLGELRMFDVAADASPSIAGGGFILGGGITVTCTGGGLIPDTTTLLTWNGGAGTTSNINSTTIRGINSLGNGMVLSGLGTINITADLVGPTSGGAKTTIIIVSNCIVNVIGSLSGGSGSGDTSRVIWVNSVCTLNITGNIIGQTSSETNTLYISANAVVKITGDVIGNATGSGNKTIRILAAVNLEITGNIISNNTGAFNTIETTQVSFIKHVGSMIVNGFGPCIFSSQATAINIFSGPFICSSYGFVPYQCVRMHLIPSVGSYFEFRDETTNGAVSPGAIAPATRLVSPATLVDNLAPSDVRFGTTYALGTLTGTLRMPTATQVTSGIQVDNTFGSAVLTIDGIWDYLVTNINTPDSIGMRLKNVSTPQTTGEQLEAFLRLD